MTKYLYGAAVQGIQAFIFQTNKLKEIIGASELVEQICTSEFADQLGKNPGGKDNEFLKKALEDDENCIIAAAGNIKYIFDKKEDCQKMVREFPKRIMNFAPGITISQAVVELEDGADLSASIDALEIKLKTQRNKSIAPVDKCFMSIDRARRTGEAGVAYQKDEVIDSALFAKTNVETRSVIDAILPKELSLRTEHIPFDFEDMCEEDDSSYLAVIHADGNNLGKFIQHMNTELKGKDSSFITKAFRNFSQSLDRATKKAAQDAFRSCFQEEIEYKLNENKKFKVPLRPIILGGDDLTVVCSVKYALQFTHAFLVNFERETESEFKKNLSDFISDTSLSKLTACAGIAFVKKSFPFHYAVDLAEELCGASKKESKKDLSKDKPEDVPASISFHKVEGSHFDSFSEIKKRVLSIGDMSLFNGPYFVDSKRDMSGIDTLFHKLDYLNKKNAPVAQLRQWLTESYTNRKEANNHIKRTIEVLESRDRNEFVKHLELENLTGKLEKTDIYDLLVLHSLGMKPLVKETLCV